MSVKNKAGFKVGDHVRCVQTDAARKLVVGKTYHIRDVNEASVFVHGEDERLVFNNERFETLMFESGQYVECIDANSASPTLEKGGVYVVEAVEGCDDGTDQVRVNGYWWLANRFRVADLQPRNPCAAGCPVDIDWKSRYDNVKACPASRSPGEQKLCGACVSCLKAKLAEAEKKEADAVETAKLLSTECATLRDRIGSQATSEKVRVMERALFLATHYNWGRKGLDWETVARDMYNYVLQGVGEKPVPREEKLLGGPSKIFCGAKAHMYIGEKLIGCFKNIEYNVKFDEKFVGDVKKEYERKLDEQVIARAAHLLKQRMCTASVFQAHACRHYHTNTDECSAPFNCVYLSKK